MHFLGPQTPFSLPEIPRSAFVLPTVLPDDIPALKALLLAQRAAHETAHAATAAAVSTAVAAAVEANTQIIKREAQEYVQRLIEQMVLARHRLFGVSSEQLPGQGRLFDEAETLAQATTDAQDMAVIPSEPQLAETVPSDSSNTPSPKTPLAANAARCRPNLSASKCCTTCQQTSVLALAARR